MENLEDYLETHFEIASYIDRKSNAIEDNNIAKIRYTGGQGALHILAKDWTDEFQEKYKDVVWGEELEYFDELDEFLNDKIEEL